MKKHKLYKLFIVICAVFLIATGVAFNSASLLGNDSIGIFYDGIRNLLSLRPDQLGLVSNYVNAGVLVLVFFLGKHHINIGTLIYFLPFGTFVGIGNRLYPYIFQSDAILVRSLAAITGCLLIFIGVGIYIAMDIGIDPFSAFVLILCDRSKWKYARMKITFDFTLIVIGFLCGGRIGLVTIITAVAAGPCIQFFTRKTQALLQ